MNSQELLDVYLVRLKEMASERLQESDISVIDALKEALNYLEGEMKGY